MMMPSASMSSRTVMKMKANAAREGGLSSGLAPEASDTAWFIAASFSHRRKNCLSRARLRGSARWARSRELGVPENVASNILDPRLPGYTEIGTQYD
jgi:hypothetical protein